MDSHALALQLGRHDWLLLPDRQAWLAWQASRSPTPRRVWLGFPPRAHERRALQALAPAQLWMSGAAPARLPLPRGWSASGVSGSLGTGGA
jgi:competence protein ComEC